jgi:hemerythrin-like domain-containing protein
MGFKRNYLWKRETGDDSRITEWASAIRLNYLQYFCGRSIHMSAIEILVDEHSLISRMMSVLSTLQNGLERNGHTDINVKILNDVVDFFRVFVDENHHAKEEIALFPVLEQHGVSIKGCTIQSLKSQHQEGREFMKTLADALREYDGDNSMARTKVSYTLRDTVDLYKDHIWRENILLFPESEKVLQKSELSDVTKAFAVIEKKFGTGFRVKYEELVNTLDTRA